MNEVKVCPKCNGEMEEGHSLGLYGGSGIVWSQGNPHNKLDFFKKKVIGDKNAPKMHSFACRICGFVERYVERNNSERLAAVND